MVSPPLCFVAEEWIGGGFAGVHASRCSRPPSSAMLAEPSDQRLAVVAMQPPTCFGQHRVPFPDRRISHTRYAARDHRSSRPGVRSPHGHGCPSPSEHDHQLAWLPSHLTEVTRSAKRSISEESLHTFSSLQSPLSCRTGPSIGVGYCGGAPSWGVAGTDGCRAGRNRHPGPDKAAMPRVISVKLQPQFA